MVRVRPGSTDSSSSGVTMTYSPPPRSYPFTTSAYSTSSPVRSLTRFCRIRSEVPDWNWLKWMVLSSVAVKSPTGTLTRPKLSDPVQIALGMAAPFAGGVQPVKHGARPPDQDLPGSTTPLHPGSTLATGPDGVLTRRFPVPGAQLDAVGGDGSTRFAHEAILGLAVLEPEDRRA